MNKLSHSSVRLYSECSKKYYLHYQQRLRSKTIGGALVYGSAIDNALNHLLKSKNLQESLDAFDKSWSLQYINDKLVQLSKSSLIVYADKDFDHELLQKEDYDKFKEYKDSLNLFPFMDLLDCVKDLKEKKSDGGLNSLSEEEKQLLSYGNWLSMRRKGHIMIHSYNVKVMPQIEEVIEVQKKFEIKNKDGDSIVGVGDLLVKMKDKGVYVIDNKTSTRQYMGDAGMRSPQLILYYHVFKKKYKLDGVGFIVMYKAMKKNRKKVCKVCGFDDHTTHTKCNNMATGKRCSGPLDESINPECDIDVILNKVSPAAEQLVMESFDEANYGINQQVFRPNLLACGDYSSPFRCQYYQYCWEGDNSELVKLNESSKK